MELADWNKPIDFKDPEVKRICAENWDTDGDGELSVKEAAAIKGFGTAFKGNAEIRTFHELRLFPKIDYSPNGVNDLKGFSGSSIQSLTLPEWCTNLSRHFLTNCYRLDHLILPPNITWIPESVLYVGTAFRYLVALPMVPPGCHGNAFGYRDANQKLKRIYVPDGSLEAYKASSFWGWGGWKLYPLSSFRTDFSNENDEDIRYYGL